MVVKDLKVTGSLEVDVPTTSKDLKVTNSLDVTGTSTLGQWKVRGDRIGIDGRGDMHLANDQWLRLRNFNADTYNAQGFAGNNMWAENATSTKSLGVTETSTLGKWKVRNDRIGIDGRGDLHLADDYWLRLKTFDKETYNPTGFASFYLWTNALLHP